MQKYLVAASLLLGMGTFNTQAATYDLATDFSSTSNPNGVCSYTQSGTPITQSIPSTFIGNGSGWGNLPFLDGSVLKWSPHTVALPI